MAKTQDKEEVEQPEAEPETVTAKYSVVLPIQVDGKVYGTGDQVATSDLEAAGIKIPALVESGHIKES